MNEWTDIVIEVNCSDTEQAAAIAQMCVTGGLYIEDYTGFEEDIKMFGPVEIVDKDLLEKVKDQKFSKIHIYISPEDNPAEAIDFLRTRLELSHIPYRIDHQSVDEEDWANNWKKYFKPIPVGDKLVIVPTWEEEAYKNSPEYEENRKMLLIDPGMAFGSGQHETTKLCLEMAQKYITPGCSVLDVGTGSGILSIAGLLLGAQKAVGVDIDKLSVKIAGENAELNGVGKDFTGVCGDLAKDITGKFDIVMANIVADIILILLNDAARLMADKGVMILSGIITEREADVLEGIAAAGLSVAEIAHDRGWAAITCKNQR